MTEETEITLADVSTSADLDQIVGRYPLPDGVPDQDMNQAELAMAMNKTANTVGKWMARAIEAEEFALVNDEPNGVPVVQKGGPGQAYVIRLSHAWAWQQHNEELRKGRTERVQGTILKMQAHFQGLDVDDDAAVIDPTMRKRMAEADLVWSQAQVKRRRLVELSELTEMLEDVLSIVRDGIEGMSDRLERELGLSADRVDVVQRVGDDILNNMADRIEKAHLQEVGLDEVDVPERLVV